MKKILVICGPTATGKTALGIKMAKKFNGEIISADSRQVYKYMDIGTGKEWNNEVKIWGYDLVDPRKKYSVSEYFKEIKIIITDIWSRNKLPILVGGTGLYIKSLIDGIPTVDIPRNDNLRNNLEKMTTDELFEKLATLDGTKAASLNLSDRKNSRRLIRAIEVAVWNIENETQKQVVESRKSVLDSNVDVLQVGITSDLNTISKNIKKRVDKRMNDGFIDEVELLLKMGISWKFQSMNSLGYRESEAFFKEGLTYEEFIEQWERDELKYAKRQMTWFKKDKRIKWFDASDIDLVSKVENSVQKWYSLDTNDKES